jgi:[citrate (pro-3S)-lyase] ligase
MTFEDTDFRLEVLDLKNPYDVKLVSQFLQPLGFDFIKDEVECSIILYTLKGEIIGTGSHKGKILKYVAVSASYRDSTAFALIVTQLTEKLLKKYRHTFVFTRPSSSIYFRSLGFTEIGVAEPLFCVLEFGFESIKTYQKYLQSIKKETSTEKVACIVANCNPFTKGHQYLIEKAATENELVYLFVVEEGSSAFPFAIRWELIRKGISVWPNVIMVKGGEYIVSGAIFPSYFLKNESVNQIMEKQAELDVNIFANYMVPALNIKKRYIGTEVYCKTTEAYNKAMHRILPKHGVEVVEITRLATGIGQDSIPEYISASKVREAIRNNKLETILPFLPDSTKAFLLSEESKEIKEKIKGSKDRH